MADIAIGGILEIGSEASVSTFLCSWAFPFFFFFFSLFLFLFLDTWYLIYNPVSSLKWTGRLELWAVG